MDDSLGSQPDVFAFKWHQGAAIGRNVLHAARRFGNAEHDEHVLGTLALWVLS
jgi:hypothetical protein